MNEVQAKVELKYCERCGGLWLRPAGLRSVYCCRCECQMRELPLAGYRKPGLRRRQPAPLEFGIQHASSEASSCNAGGVC